METVNGFQIRKTQTSDLPRVLEIYAAARQFMAAHGNPDQWKTHKPTLEQIENDIKNGNGYVCLYEGEIHGVFCFFIGKDPTYGKIIGEWKNDGEYAVVHRIASSGKVRGVGTHMMKWAFQKHPNVRIDTHEDNIVMQNMLKKLGYEFCGTIFLENGDPRLAFQKFNRAEN
ncbi:MAG: GNAT family N-acetyltransferase [Clostridia bacterium]|nr:GNAT family N-acetyltransferase [Clostridia bacterium]